MTKRIGITGGIGSGKSVISDIFRQRGYIVYDSDIEAKRLMCSDERIIKQLVARYGNEVYVDGKLNKELLANKMFGNRSEVEFVNGAVHPVVFEDFIRKSYGKPIIFIESAILYECGLDMFVDKVITVEAPLDVRIARVIKRDNTTAEKVLKRIEHQQMTDNEAAKQANWVINNDGIEELTPQIDRILSEIL